MPPPEDAASAPATQKRLEVPRPLVEFILLGPEDDRRQLQDSPILGDVWIEFARTPGQRLELLITPYKDQAAGTVASVLTGDRRIADGKVVDSSPDAADDPFALGEANIAFLQGIVAARLTFEEVIRFVVPMTSWWSDKRIEQHIRQYTASPADMKRDIENVLTSARQWFTRDQSQDRMDLLMRELETHKRYIALAGLILWAQHQAPDSTRDTTLEKTQRLLDRVDADAIVAVLQDIFAVKTLGPKPASPLVWTVSLNRRASAALIKSVAAVKADAARTLFTVNCSAIRWAVIDSGVDAGHHAFFTKAGENRIERTFDFTRIRDIVSLDNLRPSKRRDERIEALLAAGLTSALTKDEAAAHLQKLAQGAKEGRSFNWELVEPFVEVDIAKNQPRSNHGTHVAGIIGANHEGCPIDTPPSNAADRADGMCPDIKLYDFRVLGGSIRETEFAIIAALQYIRYVNERNSFITIHGANLSLSIPHDVRNYACGRTPVCNECERLVNSGVVVVAAAGNRGYQNFETKDGVYESYAAFSVTDPGNADGVITVGATHRYWPHTYGVSFFSSRGPTGDGRIKPDLVAPGERIRAPLPNQEWGDLDGTSMAAPHVSGAAAMLMARYSELIGQPRRIKDILCRSATDLGREKTFQGHGMLDVLRAFQNV